MLIASFACYAVALATARSLSLRVLVGTILTLHLLVVLAPPLFSTDMFSYQAYARMGAIHGVNPYLAGPTSISHDALYPYLGFKWTGTPTVYGPLFTLLSYATAGLSIAASVWVFKAIAAIASLLMLVLVWKIARVRAVDPVRAVALVGLNPLLILYGVGGGHNDLLMLLLLVGGVYLVLGDRQRSGGAAMVGAASVKLAGGLPLLFALAARDRSGSRSWGRLLAGAVAAAGAVGLVAAGLFGRGILHLPATLGQVQSDGGWHSIAGFLVKSFHLGAFHHPISIGLGILCLAVCAWLVSRVWRERMDWIRAAGWAAVAVLLSASSLLPWYLVWLLPLAAVSLDRRLWITTVALSGAILAINLIDYFPHSSFVWSL